MSNIGNQLETSRRALLDLSTRNRLLNIPQNSKQAKVIEIVDELSIEVFRLLVKQGKALNFLPAAEKRKSQNSQTQEGILFADEEEDIGELAQPEDEEMDERGVAKRHADYKLQTLLTSEGLQKRLLTLYYDAITFEEEQGVNILYLALGTLKWYEADNSDIERNAPLILVPISLERGSAAEKFKIKWRQEEPAANLSLQAKLKAEFEIIIPDLPEDDDLDILAYMRSVQDIVSVKKRFTVEENKMVVGFFSFAKFLMYRDLDPNNWPNEAKLDAHPLIAGLMQNGFSAEDGMIDEDAFIDEYLSPERIFHVVDADSSQSLAIEEVRKGRNLVIQGPPGTGKSQTITNVIASAVADGKKVLFVAEKMAALEVVQRRMNNIGLGPLCFELHSSKANKRSVLEELKRTKELGRPMQHEGDRATTALQNSRDKLNKHASVMHQVLQPSALTAYNAIGHLVRLKQNNVDAKGIILEKAQDWSILEKKEREVLLSDISTRIRELGVPKQHVWCGVNRQSLTPSEFEKLNDLIIEINEAYKALLTDVETTERIFSPDDNSIKAIKIGSKALRLVAAAPETDLSTISDAAWMNSKMRIAELLETGRQLNVLKAELEGKVKETVWKSDLVETRQQIAMHGKSFFRFFNSKYKQSINLFKSLLNTDFPATHEERLLLLDNILSIQTLTGFINENETLGKAALGKTWQGSSTEWDMVSALIDWHTTLPLNELPKNFLIDCAKIDKPKRLTELATKFDSSVTNTFEKIESLFNVLQLEISIAFEGLKTLDDIDRNVLHEKLRLWLGSIESISRWINFKSRFDKLSEAGLNSIAIKLWDGTIAAESATNVFERAYYDALAEIIFHKHPELRNFDGEQHHMEVTSFRSNDKFKIEQARVELRGKHYTLIPRNNGGIGPLGVLNGEFAKKRNHLPIRQLIKKAGPAIQALKPVFMMSPLSVAQFLEPGTIQFDLLVVDEASQIEPVDALGAVARAKQIVVVGDTRQLPPTRFFSRVTGNLQDNDDDDNTVATTDVESILSLCLARGLPQRMLRWHYRSKHQSLIAVSNKEFYENKLFIVPSPYDAASGMGLKFNYLKNGVFDSGGSGTNKIEAQAVAQAVIDHAKKTPNLSLGIGTFSIKQKDAIRDELELLRRQNPDTEAFFSTANSDEPFFLKNLENIQGDERDVIFISVGYGKNQSGYMAMNFGPVGKEGGERRLNVLISRAKRRCEVFASITGDDIDLERGKGVGVAALKLFLKFAETGKLDYGKLTEREPDSVFEEQVATVLRSKGFDVKTQIGLAGFFVDLAIVDPDRPGRFLLGIECDGANYHSSRSARDRDRLRQTVLEDHGWIIHRIWSTDWFRRPTEQLQKTIAAIEEAKNTLSTREEEQEVESSNGIFEITASEDTLTVRVGEKELSVLYKEASFPVLTKLEPHEVPDHEMATIVEKIIEEESPIHESEIVGPGTHALGAFKSRKQNSDKSKIKSEFLTT